MNRIVNIACEHKNINSIFHQKSTLTNLHHQTHQTDFLWSCTLFFNESSNSLPLTKQWIGNILLSIDYIKPEQHKYI